MPWSSLLLLTVIAASSPAVEPDAVEVECSVAVNGAGQGELEPGMPVVFEAVCFAGDEERSSSARVAIAALDGADPNWPLERIVDDSRSIWVLSSAATERLGAGEYLVTAVLGGEKRTSAQSAPSILRVVAKGTGKGADSPRYASRLRYELVRGKTSEAATLAGAWLERDPKSIEALVVSGDVAVNAGDLAKALKLYEKALTEWLRAHPGAAEPPIELLLRRSAVQRARFSEAAADPAGTR